jgi:hypothetical protein
MLELNLLLKSALQNLIRVFWLFSIIYVTVVTVGLVVVNIFIARKAGISTPLCSIFIIISMS